jgi:hypothetical protein
MQGTFVFISGCYFGAFSKYQYLLCWPCIVLVQG